MEEGTSKAIPIRRSRAAARSVAAPVPRWTDGIGAGVRGALGAPRQLWLATLGGTALAVEGARTLWTHLVAEGETVEAALLRALPGGTRT